MLQDRDGIIPIDENDATPAQRIAWRRLIERLTMPSPSIRDQLPPGKRAEWDAWWAKLLTKPSHVDKPADVTDTDT